MITLENITKKKVVYETETYGVDASDLDGVNRVKITVHKQNGKIKDYSFESKINPFGNKTEENKEYIRYWYFRHEILDECKNKHYTDIKYEKFLIPFEDFKDEKIDYGRVLCPYHSGHMIFRLKDLYPVSTVMISDYIDGISERYYDVKKAFEYLKQHPFVKEVEIQEIPYYNGEDDNTKGLFLKIYIPDKNMKKIWDLCKDQQFPTCKVKEILFDKFGRYKADPLGINKFLKKRKDD